MDKIIDVEKKYLEYTEKVIESEINKYLENEKATKFDSIKLSFEDRLRGTHFNLNSELMQLGQYRARLEKSKDCPYFGRFDYKGKTSSEVLPIYIGRTAINHNDSPVVYDWRSPICGLYYDCEVGPVSYNTPYGIQNGDLLLKRQITINNGKLLNAVDTNLVTDDELLLPYLNVNVDNRMKTIIASIQKEQNRIIRADNNDIIVQGVAGSGKTSVALHRVAYLIYIMKDKIKSNNFLVIGPNDYFLNYISSILPDLETTPVEQKTLLNLMNDYIGTNLVLNDYQLSNNKEKQEMQKNISIFKGSFEYRDLLDKFVERCFNGNEIIADDFKIDGKVVFQADTIRKSLLATNGNFFNFEITSKKYKRLFKENKEEIFEQLNKEYRKMYISLPMEDPTRKEYVDKSFKLKKLVYEQGEKLLDKYLKSINKSCLSLYVLFISKLDKEITSLTNEEVKLLQKDTLMAIKKKQILFEDISALLYLNYMITNKKIDYKNVVIDEAQDYSIFAYYVLKKILASAKFNIYGDLAQSIYSYRSINSWEEVNKEVFDNKCNLLELSKSYRTTIEITEAANNVLTSLNLKTAQPVIRHGTKVSYIDTANDSDIKFNKIIEWINFGYKTIAVICKDEDEAKNMQHELVINGIDSKYISNKDNEYMGGVFVLTASSAKGLEFDCTIINDASSNIYNANNDVDMHLLYVASTRALHEQVIMYNKTITEPFKNEVQNTKAFVKIK